MTGPKKCLLLFLSFILCASIFIAPVFAAPEYSPRQRLGIGWEWTPGVSNDIYDWWDLGVGIYTDWGYDNTSNKSAAKLYSYGLDRLTLVGKGTNEYTDLDCQAVTDYVHASPESFPVDKVLWSVDNELGYDNHHLTASLYATEFVNWRDCIKRIDPNYRVGSGAIISAWNEHPRVGTAYCVSSPSDPNSGESFFHSYISKIKRIDPTKLPDFIVAHGYVDCVPGVDTFDKFKRSIIEHRTMMKNEGLQDKDLIIKEYSLGGKSDVITNAVNFLMTYKDSSLGNPNDENRLVQRSLWFAFKNQIASNATGQIRGLGLTYQSLISKYAGKRTGPPPTVGKPPPTIVSGDANGDGVVNDADFRIWLINYHKKVSIRFSGGDFNSDGIVDGLDYVILYTNYAK